ncbi:23S rRNA (adenine(2503)-C(2))-methyltransferase RlmN [uncultured Ruminococcus sp.]|uniref:23S rRNA (adenine(2503)-C(2))-methyltransferase RlmN n=1 Tax=uncultured Ruminococcus sp. TaxID=165186 RepID=UPI0026372402|nr:23S rRNA (adenine(2503)-C(2))-methyltransferase RlmN [uncultured Ruminococcus sp.]
MEKVDILSLDLDELTEALTALGEKKFRAKQIFQWLHVKRVFDFDKMTDISVQLRSALKEKFCINGLFIQKKLESAIDNTVKYLYRLSDGNYVETVLMEYNYGYSICVSTQVGCKMGCNFCASTIAGYVRDLAASEILMQIYEAERDSGRKVSGVVLMGIGEPLDNFDNVMKFLTLLSHKDGNDMSLRHVSLSTCGIVPRIYELADRKYQLTLSVSLHCADNEGRSRIMPVNRKYDISSLMEACRYYIDRTGRRITFEYAVIDNVNSSPADADKLAALLRGMNCHVNLIPVNKVRERNYRTVRSGVAEFAKQLGRRGINATVRRTLGSDIEAACGQLRRDAAQQRSKNGGADT